MKFFEFVAASGYAWVFFLCIGIDWYLALLAGIAFVAVNAIFIRVIKR